MILASILVLFYFLTPALIVYLTHISKLANKIGAVVMAYAIGLLVGNSGLFPTATEAYSALVAGKSSLPGDQVTKLLQDGVITPGDVLRNEISSIQNNIITIVIPLAIPLLLFSLDLKRWLKLAREAMLSLALGVISLLIVVIVGYFLFKNSIDGAWKVSGMLVGIYTGGTPNLAAISTALEVNPTIFILTHTYDLVLGAVCLLFLLTSAQRLFNRFLPHFSESHRHVNLKNIVQEAEGVDNYIGMLTRSVGIQLAKALGLAILIVAAGGGLGLVVPEKARMVTVILTITTLGLAFSTIKWVNRLEKTFQLGMYLIIVFSLVVSSMANLLGMFRIEFLSLFLFVMLGVFGSMIIHVGLSYIFRVDTDTTIVTITALTFSPPFVPVVAGALRNRDIILSGLTTGILGYVFGNYLGIALAYFLKGF
jgi:uncharacterized membrane protein